MSLSGTTRSLCNSLIWALYLHKHCLSLTHSLTRAQTQTSNLLLSNMAIVQILCRSERCAHVCLKSPKGRGSGEWTGSIYMWLSSHENKHSPVFQFPGKTFLHKSNCWFEGPIWSPSLLTICGTTDWCNLFSPFSISRTDDSNDPENKTAGLVYTRKHGLNLNRKNTYTD